MLSKGLLLPTWRQSPCLLGLWFSCIWFRTDSHSRCLVSVSWKDVVHGPWRKWRMAEDHMPGSIAASCGSFLDESAQHKSGILAVHHYLVRTQIPTSETGKSETLALHCLAQYRLKSPTSETEESKALASHRLLICHKTLNKSFASWAIKWGVDKMIHTILYWF